MNALFCRLFSEKFVEMMRIRQLSHGVSKKFHFSHLPPNTLTVSKLYQHIKVSLSQLLRTNRIKLKLLFFFFLVENIYCTSGCPRREHTKSPCWIWLKPNEMQVVSCQEMTNRFHSALPQCLKQNLQNRREGEIYYARNEREGGKKRVTLEVCFSR